LTKRAAVAVAVLALSCAGCIQSIALNAVADGLSGSGTTFSGDEDPELVREAIPFGLKTYESLLAELPEHRGLLLATASGFTQYAYAFVMSDADRIDADDAARAREYRARAKKLFLRGRDYALRGLELEHSGLRERLRQEREGALSDMSKDDVDFLYWAGVSWAAALMAEKGDLSLMADLPLAGALVTKSIELDPSYNSGAAHEFMISFEGSRPEASGGSPARARQHYAKALEISGGKRASVHLGLAEAVSIRAQDLKEFRALLAKALAVDPEADRPQRLVNVLARRRAQWLLGRIPDLFLEAEEEKK
jgi:predicted anti-sigma-YlaC factor YlaD